MGDDRKPSVRRWRGAARIATPFFIAAALAMPTAHAGVTTLARPSERDIAAVAHTLAFVEGIPRIGTVKIGVVYEAGNLEAAQQAQELALRLSKADGPGSADIAAIAVAADMLGNSAEAFQAFLILPGGNSLAPAVVAEATKRRLVTISTDPACLELRSCVLSVQGEPNVSVTLDTGLAAELGVKISPIFTMMVKRK